MTIVLKHNKLISMNKKAWQQINNLHKYKEKIADGREQTSLSCVITRLRTHNCYVIYAKLHIFFINISAHLQKQSSSLYIVGAFCWSQLLQFIIIHDAQPRDKRIAVIMQCFRKHSIVMIKNLFPGGWMKLRVSKLKFLWVLRDGKKSNYNSLLKRNKYNSLLLFWTNKCSFYLCPTAPTLRLAHAAAASGRQLLHLVPAVRVVQKGHVFVVAGSAAGRVVPQLREHGAVQQVGQGEVVVGGDAGAPPAAVLEEDRLVGVVAQTEISNLQQEGTQAAGGVQSGATGPGQGWRVHRWTRSRCVCSWIPGCRVHSQRCRLEFLTWKREKVPSTLKTVYSVELFIFCCYISWQNCTLQFPWYKTILYLDVDL